MKKYFLAIGTVFSIFLAGQSVAEIFPVSGIDMENSFIELTYNSMEGASPFSCLGNTSTSQNFSFADAGWDAGNGKFNNLRDCFTSSGRYQLEIKVADKAGNNNSYLKNIIVNPGSPCIDEEDCCIEAGNIWDSAEGKCSSCPIGRTYNSSTGRCDLICGDGCTYNSTQDQCSCPVGCSQTVPNSCCDSGCIYQSDGTCNCSPSPSCLDMGCSENNDGTCDCNPVCNSGENSCCSDGYSYIDGECICSGNDCTPTPSCEAGCSLIDDKCVCSPIRPEICKGNINNCLSSYETLADGNSFLNLFIKLFDANGNQVNDHVLDNSTLCSNNGEYRDDANMGTSFRNGLRVNGLGQILPKCNSPLSINGIDFQLGSVSPSISKAETERPNFLSRLISREINFLVGGIGNVSPNGSIANGNNFVKIAKNFRFLNPVFSNLEIPNLSVSEVVDINLEVNNDNGASNPNIINESNLVSIGEPQLCDSDLNGADELTGCGTEIVDNNISIASPRNYQKRTGEIDNTIIRDATLSLINYLTYELGGNKISYPAGGVGKLFEDLKNKNSIIGLEGNVEIRFVGADIEGFVSVDEEKAVLGTEDNKLINIGFNNSQKDIYEKIVKNGWELARNANSQSSINLTNDFVDNDVVVVKNPVNNVLNISGALPEGKKTLVLIDANLRITGELFYENNDDSFGVIILRSQAGAEPPVGNIFVNSNVQKIAGSYFADGGLMNLDQTDDPNKDFGNQTESKNQLLLEGSLLSRNTLGGSIRGQDNASGATENEDYSPWATGISNDVAKRYDLHFVRRYYPGDGNKIPGENNKAAFIIRPDQKSTVLTPPGFKVK